MEKKKEQANASDSFRKSDREFVMTRVFNAPRELVFQVYTDPAAAPQWWGPRYLTTTVDKMDVRPGGLWRFIQRGPDGKEYAFRGEYIEIVRPSKIVSTFEFEAMPGHIVTDTLLFEQVGNKTRLTATSLFQSPEDLDGMMQSGMEGGANETWDRLEEVLAAQETKTV
jgi:uncharacterized protein YndB with AHSA1/START domain